MNLDYSGFPLFQVDHFLFSRGEKFELLDDLPADEPSSGSPIDLHSDIFVLVLSPDLKL